MEVTTQNFAMPAIDWTKANLLISGRLKVIILNEPTAELGETAAGTVLQSLEGAEVPEADRVYKTGEYYTDFDPLSFELFNGQVLLTN